MLMHLIFPQLHAAGLFRNTLRKQSGYSSYAAQNHLPNTYKRTRITHEKKATTSSIAHTHTHTDKHSALATSPAGTLTSKLKGDVAVLMLLFRYRSSVFTKPLHPHVPPNTHACIKVRMTRANRERQRERERGEGHNCRRRRYSA